MYYLENLQDLKIYKNKKIMGIEKTKRSRFGTSIISIGNNKSDFIKLINSNLFQSNYYKSIYVNRISKSVNKLKKKSINQPTYYKEVINRCPTISFSRKTIPMYKKLNLYYDAFPEFELNEVSLKSKGIIRLESFKLFLEGRIATVNPEYDNIIVAINVDDNIEKFSDYIKLNNMKTPLAYFYNSIKRNSFVNNLGLLETVTFMIYSSSNNSFFKFKLNEETVEKKKQVILMRILKLVNSSVNDIVTDNDKEKPVVKSIIGDIEKAPKKDIVDFDIGIDDIDTDTEDDFPDNEERVDKDNKTIEKTVNIVNQFKNILNMNSKTRGLVDVEVELIDKMSDEIENTIEDNDLEDKSEDDIVNELNNNQEFKSYLNDLKNLKKNGKIKEVNKEKLIAKQDEVILNNLSIKDIMMDFKSSNIDLIPIESKSILHETVKTSTLKDFDNSYIKKQMDQDMLSVLSSFNNDPDIGLYVTNINKENTSNDLNKKETYTVSFEDTNKVKHTMKIDVPIIKEGRFMMLNGGKKLIIKQILLKPIVKTKTDTVQVTTNYNKFFITRFGKKRTDKSEFLKKIFATELKDHVKENNVCKYKRGDSSRINSGYDNTIEYNDISEYLLWLDINDYHIVFDHSELTNMLDPNNEKYVKALGSIGFDNTLYHPVGYTTNPSKLILVDYTDKKVFLKGSDDIELLSSSLNTFIMGQLDNILEESAYEKVNKFKPSKGLSFTRVKINNKEIPMIVLLGYELGISDILNRYNIKFEFDTKNRRFNINDDKGKIKFKDGYLYYDNSKLRNSLLLSGLSVMATENFDFSEFDTKTPYLETFLDLYHSRNVGKGFHNTLTLMVDPITLDVLKALNLPENVYDILLYSNTLLEDLSYNKLNDMNSYRIRGAEQVNALLYKITANAFRTYKDTSKSGNPLKVSVPQDILIKKLMESPTVDEYSVLNPSLEIEKLGAATYKGPGGTNLDNSYTKDIRSYDKTMTGILALNSPDSDKVGVVRQLTYNTSIINTRGFLDVNKKNSDNSTDLYSAAELLSPFTSLHADPPRIGIDYCVPLWSNL